MNLKSWRGTARLFPLFQCYTYSASDENAKPLRIVGSYSRKDILRALLDARTAVASVCDHPVALTAGHFPEALRPNQRPHLLADLWQGMPFSVSALLLSSVARRPRPFLLFVWIS